MIHIARLFQLECSLIRCAISRLQLAFCKINIPRLSRCIQNVSRLSTTMPALPRQLNIFRTFPEILGNVYYFRSLIPTTDNKALNYCLCSDLGTNLQPHMSPAHLGQPLKQYKFVWLVVMCLCMQTDEFTQLLLLFDFPQNLLDSLPNHLVAAVIVEK